MQIFKNKMFMKWAQLVNLNDSTLKKAVMEVEQGLVDADLGGNLVKKRISRMGQGKRGGYRTILIFKKKYRVIFIYGFSKNQQSNISRAELTGLKKLGQYLLDATESELKQMIINGDLYEVNDNE